MARRMLASIRRAVSMPRDERIMLYTMLAAQLRAGVVASRACAALEGLDGLDRGTRQAARAGAQAEMAGRTVIEGMADTGLLPPDEVGVLLVAEQNSRLTEALGNLVDRDSDTQGFAVSVLAPNVYYGVILGVVTLFVWGAEGFLGDLGFDQSENPLLRMSTTLQAWLVPGLAMFSVIVGIGWHGMRSWTGPARRLLGIFDTQARLQAGIVFTDLAELMSLHGAANTAILETVIDIYRGDRYLHHHAARALRSIRDEGAGWEPTLGRGLLMPAHADLLQGLVPGGARCSYPGAYRALGAIQRQILKRRFRSMRTILQIALLGLTVWMMGFLIDGMYSIYDSVQF